MKIFPALLFLLFFCLSVFSQTPTPAPDKPAFLQNAEEIEVYSNVVSMSKLLGLCANLMETEDCKKNYKDYEVRYREAIKKAVNYPNVIYALLLVNAQNYEGTRITARSAPQVSQVADEHNVQILRIIVMQNQRIIELLEQLVKKK